MYIFSKFFLVGVLNTALDFAVLNLCLYAFGTGTQGAWFALFKAISFSIAVVNSYVCNKWWVFEHSSDPHAKEFLLFLAVSLVGFLINVSISYVMFSIFVHEFSASVAANAAALMGTVVVFAWNFVGYRFFVFHKSHE